MKIRVPKEELCPPAEMAKWFINRVDRDAGEAMTHLKLQKLLYFSQAYFLANFNKPLFNEDMQAWTHGPVVPSVWQTYKGHGWEAIPTGPDPEIDDPKIVAYLEAVYDKFGRLGAKRLEEITHSHDPWKETRDGFPSEARCEQPIPKIVIRDFYAKRIKKSW